MLAQLITWYTQFLNYFPVAWHGGISLVLLFVIVILIFHVLQRSGIWLVLLILLVPALIPVLKELGQTLIEFLKVLLSHAKL